MLNEKDRLKSLEHLHYMREYRRKLIKRHDSLYLQKGSVFSKIWKVAYLICSTEGIFLSHMIEKIKEFIDVYDEAIKMSVKFNQGNATEEEEQMIYLLLCNLNLLLHEEVEKNCYPDKFKLIAKYANNIVHDLLAKQENLSAQEVAR